MSGSSLAEFLRRRRHSALLITIIISFVVRPLIGESWGTQFAFNLAVLTQLLVALHAIRVDDLKGDRTRLLARWHRQRLVAWVLATVAIAARVVLIFVPGTPVFVAAAAGWLTFFVFVTAVELGSLLRYREITGETISLAVSIYLLLGLCWGLLYIVLFLQQPGAFNFSGSSELAAGLADRPEQAFPVFVYFSLTTLATIGFGDITPVSLPARYAAVAEGITGQFYLTILIARLVGMQISNSGRRTDG